MPVKIEIVGLKRLKRRMRQFPIEYNKAVELTLRASLLKIWENVPPYPKPPAGSKYIRTGTLGRSLGSGTGGGKSQGEPDTFRVFEQGGNIDGAEFGTRINYAPFVLGENQAKHMSHWWTFRKLARKSRPEIIRLFKVMAKKLVKFLEGKGQL